MTEDQRWFVKFCALEVTAAGILVLLIMLT
jgi:hypothetical protein